MRTLLPVIKWRRLRRRRRDVVHCGEGGEEWCLFCCGDVVVVGIVEKVVVVGVVEKVVGVVEKVVVPK